MNRATFLSAAALLTLTAVGGCSAQAIGEEGEDIGTTEEALVLGKTAKVSGVVWRPPTGGLVLETACETGRDDDHDGLDDGCEGRLLNRHAPILYMPFGLDWIRPANVDWYLARTALRFHHDNCSDDQIAAVGTVSQQNILSFSHRTKQGFWSGCDHTNTVITSAFGRWDDDQHFFLQPADAVHSGSNNPSDWKVYGHAYPNTIGGVNLQYWFFYPYNDNGGPINHESDWESITVRLKADETMDGVYYCLHGHCDNFRYASQIHASGTHPIAWVADGSHATYPAFWECEDASVTQEAGGPNCEWDDNQRWFTWAGGKGAQAGYQGWGVVNVGEKRSPLNGQSFVSYGGSWGEVGSTATTSGKRTPSFQDDWNMDRR